MLAVSSEDTELVSVESNGGDASHRTFKVAFAAGNSLMSFKLQSSLLKSGSSNCSENPDLSCNVSLRKDFKWSTDAGLSGSSTLRMLVGEM